MKIVFTDAYIKSIKQSGRYTDGATTGLNLNIKSKGGGYWVFRYLFEGIFIVCFGSNWLNIHGYSDQFMSMVDALTTSYCLWVPTNLM